MHTDPIGLTKWELDTPSLCLDVDALERNITRMGAYFSQRPAKLRPHIKTHKSPMIARMQLNAGAIGLTCAKLGEAEIMAQAGIRDLLIANQIIGPQKIARLVNLAGYSDVMVAVDDAGNVAEIAGAAQRKGVIVRILIEVDTGLGRSGVTPGQAALDLARKIVGVRGLRLEGVMGYEGHTVMIPGWEERCRQVNDCMARLISTRDLLVQNGIPVPIVSGGGTGTYAITGNYPGITEVQAGSYATMDAKYKSVGADFDLALTIVARVISVTPPDRAVIDAGLKTMTTELGTPLLIKPEGWSLKKLSEEHGVLQREGGAPLHVGDTVEIVPSHGCTTINLHDAYFVTRDDIVEAVWPIAARGRLR